MTSTQPTKLHSAWGPYPAWVFPITLYFAALWHLCTKPIVAILRLFGVRVFNPRLPAVDLRNKVAIVTGTDSGIGQRTVVHLLERGAHCVMTARDKDAGRESFNQIRKEVGPEAHLELMHLDLNDLRSVEHFVEAFKRRFSRLDILVNNAGIAVSSRTRDGLQELFQGNFLGHFHLTKQLMGLLDSTDGARVVNLASVMHRFSRSLDWESAAVGSGHGPLTLTSFGILPDGYADGKMAQLLFAVELRRRFREMGARATAIAVHPGNCKTNLWRSTPLLVRPFFAIYKWALFLNSDEGCFTSMWAAAGPMDELIHVAKRRDPDGPEEPPQYLEPYLLPLGITWPCEFVGPFVGAAASHPSLPKNYEAHAKALWDTAERLVHLAQSRKSAAP